MLKKQGLNSHSTPPDCAVVTLCVWASVSPSVQWDRQLGPILGCHTVPRGGVTQTTMSYKKVTKAESQGRRTGDETNHHHSPRAQKTLSLLESGKDTFKTSLWLSKSSSGPPQLSTIGDMSCRSGRVTSETNAPAQDCCGILF